MKRFKYSIFIIAALASYCYSEEVETVQRWSDNDTNIQRIFEILAVHDEKINRIHTKVVTNEFIPKCTLALERNNLEGGKNCWKDLINQLKTVEYSTAKEIQILGQLIKSYCKWNNIPRNFLLLETFIENNVENGSKLAIGSYNTLLTAMDEHGYLYFNKNANEFREEFLYNILNKIRNAEGDASPIFTRTLPSVVNTILSRKEVYIRNNATREYFYAPSGSGNSETKMIVANAKENNTRYLWKLNPLRGCDSVFYIVNSFDNRILAIADDDGSMKLIEQQEDNSGLVFYIRLVRGSSGEEVVIQCIKEGYMNYLTLGLDENEEGKVPKLRTTFTNTATTVWLLQPKEQETF